MDDGQLIRITPRHSVRMADDYALMVQKAPQRDYVVHTLAKRMAGNMPLMIAELVIAGQQTREEFPLAREYPLHFRKTYFPGRLHGDTKDEFEAQSLASQLADLPPPIGYTPETFRSCLLPGKPYTKLSPFGVSPEGNNIRLARNLELAAAAGLWRLLELAYEQLELLHRGGLAHGDAELHNFIVCPSPLEIIAIDFEAAVQKEKVDAAAWEARCQLDFENLFREAVFLQCALGEQRGALPAGARARLSQLFKEPEQFRLAIERQADVND